MISRPRSVLYPNHRLLQDVHRYQAAGYQEPYSDFGPQSYDSATAITEALKKVLLPQGPDRRRGPPEDRQGGVDVSFDGTTGKVAFDEYSDNAIRILTLYRVENGKWTTVKTGTF